MLDQLAKQLLQDFNELNGRFAQDRDQGASLIKSLLESRLKKLNLVTREEFDTQQAVLQRALQQLQTLEQKLAAMEDKAAE